MSLTSLWVFWKNHADKAGYMLLGILLFGAGWQLGRVTSPYYAAHPIIFEDKECSSDACVSSGGTVEELAALQAEGIAQREADAKVASRGEGPTATPTGVVAAAVAGTEQRQFVGSKNSELYHHVDCPSGKRIKKENQIWWPSREAAEADGYAPSACTKEKLGLQ